jgi:hypothetical protein
MGAVDQWWADVMTTAVDAPPLEVIATALADVAKTLHEIDDKLGFLSQQLDEKFVSQIY